MIAKQKIHTGNNFMGAYDYNDQKMTHKNPQQRAELLDHNFSQYDRNSVAREVSLLQRLRPNLTRDTYHVSLNFGIEDKLTNSQLISISEDYRKGMGFDDNLYSLWQHHDADHCHAHLLIFRTKFDGSLVSDSNNFKRSEALCRQLELKYKLQVVKASKEANEKAPSKDEIEMIQRTGKLSNRMIMQAKVKSAIDKSNSISELVNNCKNHGIYLLFNQSKSTGRVSGITYILDNGFLARGQALGNIYKWKNLTKQINYEQSRDFQAISGSNSENRGSTVKAGEFKKNINFRFNKTKSYHT